jgi:hypothetical protein
VESLVNSVMNTHTHAHTHTYIKNAGIYRMAVQLVASRAVLSSKELVINLLIIVDSAFMRMSAKTTCFGVIK